MQVVGDLGRRRAGVEDDRLAFPHQARGLDADLPLLVDVFHVLERQRLDLPRHRAQERAAVLAVDVPVGLEPLQVLPDRCFGNAEGRAEIANPRAAFLLQPVEDLHPARLGEQSVQVGIQPTAGSEARRLSGSRGVRMSDHQADLSHGLSVVVSNLRIPAHHLRLCALRVVGSQTCIKTQTDLAQICGQPSQLGQSPGARRRTVKSSAPARRSCDTCAAAFDPRRPLR